MYIPCVHVYVYGIYVSVHVRTCVCVKMTLNLARQRVASGAAARADRSSVSVCASRVAAVRALVRDQALPTAMAVWDFLSGALPVFVLLFTTSGIYVLLSALRYTC